MDEPHLLAAVMATEPCWPRHRALAMLIRIGNPRTWSTAVEAGLAAVAEDDASNAAPGESLSHGDIAYVVSVLGSCILSAATYKAWRDTYDIRCDCNGCIGSLAGESAVRNMAALLDAAESRS